MTSTFEKEKDSQRDIVFLLSRIRQGQIRENSFTVTFVVDVGDGVYAVSRRQKRSWSDCPSFARGSTFGFVAGEKEIHLKVIKSITYFDERVIVVLMRPLWRESSYIFVVA